MDGQSPVEASDNVIVTTVVITILDGEGDWWEYVPSTDGKLIRAEAWDLQEM
jgi:hypothetical protein